MYERGITMAKVYIFLADGFEEIEGLTVVDLLRRAGIEISMVSITGKRKVTGAHQIAVEADLLFEDSDYGDADLLVLPGGMPGTLHLMEHEGLDKLLREFYSKKKPLAAICAAPTIFSQKGFLNGIKATCYSGMEDQLTGANVVDLPVVTDRTITTSKGLGTAIDFALSIIKDIKGETEARSIAKQILYKHYK